MRIQPSKNIQQLPLGVFNQLLRAKRRVMESGKPVIDLSVGSPDLPPPREVMEEIRKWSMDGSKYGYTLEAIPTFKATGVGNGSAPTRPQTSICISPDPSIVHPNRPVSCDNIGCCYCGSNRMHFTRLFLPDSLVVHPATALIPGTAATQG